MKAVPNARVRVEKSNLQLEVCGECAASTNLNQFKIFFGSAVLVRFPDFSCAATKHHRHGTNRMATHRGYHIPSKDWKSWSWTFMLQVLWVCASPEHHESSPPRISQRWSFSVTTHRSPTLEMCAFDIICWEWKLQMRPPPAKHLGKANAMHMSRQFVSYLHLCTCLHQWPKKATPMA